LHKQEKNLSKNYPTSYSTSYSIYYRLQKLISFAECPKRLSLGFTITEKFERKSWGMEPLLCRLKLEEILCLLGKQFFFEDEKPVKNQRDTFRCKSHKTPKNVVKKFVQNLQFLQKISEWKYDRDMNNICQKGMQ